MKSYTTLRNLYGSLTNDTSTTNLTLGDQLINDGIRRMISKHHNFYFLQVAATDLTVASQSAYPKPYNFKKANAYKVTVGTTSYRLKFVTSRAKWDKINETSYESDIPEWVYEEGDDYNIYPTPSSAGNTITVNYTVNVVDLANTDYTTGTVSITNGSAIVTGSGTTFTAAMVGRYIKVNADGNWHKIASYTSATVITLEREYGGTTVTGGAYTIGDMPILPDGYHMYPVYFAVAHYWHMNGEPVKGREYERMFNDGSSALKIEHGSKYNNPVVDDGEVETVKNPNLYVEL